MTINDFIRELQSVSEEKREIPLVIQAPNGELFHPTIKMLWDDKMEILKSAPDKMIITYKD